MTSELSHDKPPHETPTRTVPPRRRSMLFMGLLSIIALTIFLGFSFKSTLWPPSLKDLKTEYQRAVSARNWSRAEATATRWTKLAPDSSDAWMQLSNALYQQKKYEAALECLNKIVAPPTKVEMANLAKMELQFGPLNRAIEGAATCVAIISTNPRATVARQQLIQFLAMTLQRTRLVREVRSAIDAGAEPSDSYFYLFFIDVLPFANGAELNRHFLSGDPQCRIA
jgi:tetratricopeptide (TPR) repeat protein